LLLPLLRRPADTVAHLVDRVLPEVPVRQWVLSLPWQLRFDGQTHERAFFAPLSDAERSPIERVRA
jgi:hypothetical protein